MIKFYDQVQKHQTSISGREAGRKKAVERDNSTAFKTKDSG